MVSQTQTSSMTATFSPTHSPESLIPTLTIHIPAQTNILLTTTLSFTAIIIIIIICYYILNKRRRKVRQLPNQINVISPYIVQNNPLHIIPELRI